jgi:hypothetical protein
MIFSFSHNHIGMVIHAKEKFPVKRDPHCFHRQVFNHSLSILLLPERGCSKTCRKNIWAYQMTSPEKEEYFHG